MACKEYYLFIIIQQMAYKEYYLFIFIHFILFFCSGSVMSQCPSNLYSSTDEILDSLTALLHEDSGLCSFYI